MSSLGESVHHDLAHSWRKLRRYHIVHCIFELELEVQFHIACVFRDLAGGDCPLRVEHIEHGVVRR